MSSCSILTISKLTLDNNDRSVEYSKVYNSIISNPKVGLYFDSFESDDFTIDNVYKMIQDFSKDIVNEFLSIVDDVSIEIDYDQPLNELSIDVKVLITKGDQLFDSKFFDLCILYTDKYEQLSVENGFPISFDFNVMLKNEYTKTVTIKKEVK